MVQITDPLDIQEQPPIAAPTITDPLDIQRQQAIEPQHTKALALLDRLSNNPIIRFINQAGPAAQQTLADFFTGSANLAARGISGALMPGVPAAAIPQLRAPQFMPKGTPLAPAIVGSLIGSLPLMAITPGTAAKTLIGRLGQQALTGAAAQTAFAAAQPGAGLTKPAAIGAGLGAAFELPAEALSAPLFSLIKRAAIPGSPIRSPQEVAALSRQLGKLPVSLGDITNSPGLREFFNTFLRSFPGSGVAGKAERSIAQTQNIANNLEAHFRTDTPSKNILNSLENELRTTKEKLETTNRLNYHKTALDADNLGFNLIKKSSTQQKAVQVLQKEKDTVAKGDLGILQDENKASSILSKLAKGFKPSGQLPSAILGADGQPILLEAEKELPISTFNDAHSTRSKLLELSRQHARDDNLAVSKMYSSLANSLTEDMNNEISNIKDPLLDLKWKEANDFFKKNIVPVRNTAISNVLDKQGKGLDTIHSQLTKPHLESILENMSPEGRRLVAYRHFAKANAFPADPTTGIIQTAPGAMAGVYNRLGQDKALLKRLFTPEENENLKRLTAHVQISREPALAQRPPATGFRTAASMIRAGTLLGLFPSIEFLGLPETAAIAGGILGGARGLSALLTSPRVRRAYIKQIPLLQRLAPSLSTLTAAQVNQLRRGQQ